MHWKTKKNSYDLLYCGISFIAVVWNWTCSVSEVCLYMKQRLQKHHQKTDDSGRRIICGAEDNAHIWHSKTLATWSGRKKGKESKVKVIGRKLPEESWMANIFMKKCQPYQSSGKNAWKSHTHDHMQPCYLRGRIIVHILYLRKLKLKRGFNSANNWQSWTWTQICLVKRNIHSNILS